jgi:quercetin dioxygenase-like cupin family protein
MAFSLIRAANVRQTATPNATMTTLASPSLAGSEHLSLWRVELPAGGSGPRHRMSAEQVWTLLAGAASVTVAAERHDLAPGDTIYLPAGIDRQFMAATPATFLVCGTPDAVATSDEHRDGVIPPWIQ